MDFGLKLPTERVEAAAIDWTIDRGQPRHGYVEVNVFYAGLQTALQCDPPPTMYRSSFSLRHYNNA